MSKRIN